MWLDRAGINFIISSVLIIKTWGWRGRTVFRKYDNKRQDLADDEKRQEMAADTYLTNQGNNCGETMKTLFKNKDLGRVGKKIGETHLQDRTRIRKIILKSYFRKKSKDRQNMEKRVKIKHFFKIM